MKKKLLVVLLCLLLAVFGTLTVFSSDLATRCDVDGDGSVTVLDALTVLRYIANGEITPDDPDDPDETDKPDDPDDPVDPDETDKPDDPVDPDTPDDPNKPTPTQATVVVTATDKVTVFGDNTFAEPGFVQFRILSAEGHLSAVAYYCQKNALGITDDAEKYLYHSYDVQTIDNFATFSFVKKVDAIPTDKVVKANTGKITIDGTTYKLVDQHSNSVGIPEIILLNENDNFTPITNYNTENAYPEVVLFDDNSDGRPDRGLYREYQLGQYKSTSRIADVAGTGTTTILYNPIVVGLKPAANDRIVYSYNETSNVLYVKEKAQKISGVIGGINTEKAEITVGGIAYPVGIANLPGAWTTANLTTNMLGKTASVYTIGGCVVYFTDYANSSKLVIYDTYIALNPLGYPIISAYVQNHMKEQIVVSSYNFKDPISGDFLNTAQRGDLFTGTVDLSGYYNLSNSVSMTSTHNTSMKTLDLQSYTNNSVRIFGTSNKRITENTVYIVMNNGTIQTAKGLYANVNLPTAMITLLTANIGASYKIVYNSSSSTNIDFVYVSDGSFAPGVQFSGATEAADTVIYVDMDFVEVSTGIPNVYAYSNVIDIVNGGLLSYNALSYNLRLVANSFYRINDGVVVEKIYPDIPASDGRVYVKSYAPGYGIKSANINAYSNYVRVTPESGSYVTYYNTNFVGYAMIDGNIKNTADGNVVPKIFTDAVFKGTMHQKKQYIFNYKEILGNSIGGTAMPNLVCLVEYQTDFDGNSYPTYFVRTYANATNATLNPRITLTSPTAFVEYIVVRSTSGTTTTNNWDRLRTAAGGPASGDVNVTNAIKLFAADGTFVDPAKYGLTFTVKDNLIKAYNDKQSFLEIRRDPLNREILPVADNYYMTFEFNGSTYLVDKVTISLSDGTVWYADSSNSILDSASAFVGGNTFSLYVDLASAGLTVDQAKQALSSLQNIVYKADGSGILHLFDANISLVNSVSTGDGGYIFMFNANQPFSAGQYAFALSLPGDTVGVTHALPFTVS